MNNSKIKEADALVLEAEKHLKTSFFKWQPDYDSAASSYQKAALAYRNGKSLDKARDTYIKVADCRYKNSSRFHAGKAYEEAAHVCKEMKDFGKAMSYFDHASDLYLEDGTPDTAALCLDKAGKIVQMTHPEWAIASFMKAAEIYENEDKSRFRSAAELIGKVARLQVGQQKYNEAVKSIAHEKKLLNNIDGDDHGASARLTCALVLIHLTNRDQVQAEQSLYSACENLDGFEESEEYDALHKLLEAFDQHDQTKLSQILNMPLFKYMDTAYARLARSLCIPGHNSDSNKNVKPLPPTLNVKQMSEKVNKVTDQFSNLQSAASNILSGDSSKSTAKPPPTSQKNDTTEIGADEDDDLC